MVICRTPFHVVENYGSSLPVLVTETIAYADRNLMFFLFYANNINLKKIGEEIF